MQQAVDELVTDGHGIGGLGACLAALSAERGQRSGQTLLGVWSTEYGMLNRVITLWEGEPAPSAQLEAPQDWLSLTRTSRRLTRLRPLKLGLLNAAMLELRMYAIAEGKTDTFTQAILEALPHREQYSPCAGIWHIRERGVDAVLHLWAYSNLDDRNAAREKAQANPEWASYRARIPSLLTTMQAWMLKPIVIT